MQRAWRPAWSPDGAEIAFAMSGSLWNLRPGDTTAYELTSNPTYDSSPAWSPDGRFIVYTGEASNGVNLMLLNVATLESTSPTRAHPGCRSDRKRSHVLVQFQQARKVFEQRA